MKNLPLTFTGIDLFSGAGGVTTGIEQATADGKKLATVIVAINHDEMAIESHWKNHPHVKHHVEDIRTFNVDKLPVVVSDTQTRTFVWASLECTNYSNAKGGMSRDPDSRTLAEHLERYIKKFDPDYIPIENVREFKDWGPLFPKLDKNGKPMFDKNGKPYLIPDRARKGEDFRKWLKSIERLGYHYEMKILNAADFGAHTARRRLFVIFAKEGLPIAWPETTHDKHGRNGLPKWKAVKDVLDLENEGESIFTRAARGKKPLVQKTLDRIAYGINKYVLQGAGDFLISYYRNGTGVHSLEKPIGALTTKDKFALISVSNDDQFLMEYYSRNNAVTSINGPAKTNTTNNRMALVTLDKGQFITQRIWGSNSAQSLNDPCGTIITEDEKCLITVQFLQNYYSEGGQLNSIDDPSPAITTVPKSRLVSVDLEKAQFIEDRYGSKYNVKSIQVPAGALTANPKSSLITVLNNAGIIKDIKMRMLTIDELKKITGFDEEYYLEGTQAQRKKYIGNAVPPVLPQKIFETLYYENLKLNGELREAG